jgi:hypothetical protein
MLDDFRQAGNFLDEPEDEKKPGKAAPPRRFLGMTPFQTFIVTFLLLVLTCLISASCLLVTNRVVLPFL